jgi:hypothetical protein
LKKLVYLLLVVALFAALATYSGCARQTGKVEDTAEPSLPKAAVPENSSTATQPQTGTIAPGQSTYEEPDSVTTPTPPSTPAPPTSELCTTPT